MRTIEQIKQWIFGENDESPRMQVVNSNGENVNEDYSHAEAVSPSDSVDLDNTTKALYIGGDGNIKVDMEDGNTITFTGVTAGGVYTLRVNRVYSTDTTASDIVALY